MFMTAPLHSPAWLLCVEFRRRSRKSKGIRILPLLLS
jgi:hypothetical protein